jgi:hypothetical protein
MQRWVRGGGGAPTGGAMHNWRGVAVLAAAATTRSGRSYMWLWLHAAARTSQHDHNACLWQQHVHPRRHSGVQQVARGGVQVPHGLPRLDGRTRPWLRLAAAACGAGEGALLRAGETQVAVLRWLQPRRQPLAGWRCSCLRIDAIAAAAAAALPCRTHWQRCCWWRAGHRCLSLLLLAAINARCQQLQVVPQPAACILGVQPVKEAQLFGARHLQKACWPRGCVPCPAATRAVGMHVCSAVCAVTCRCGCAPSPRYAHSAVVPPFCVPMPSTKPWQLLWPSAVA